MHLNRVVLVLYASFCMALAGAAYLRPLPTFDRLLYAGAVASLRWHDPVVIHRIARKEFDAQPSRFPFQNVADEPYFADVRDNPYHFVQQLSLFRVKFAYVASGYALWRAGLPILVGLRLISATCLLIISFVVIAWTRNAILSALLLLVPPVLNMGRMATADPLSTTIVFLALFALARNRNLLAAILLLSSVSVRTDNIVLVVILLSWMARKERIRMSGAVILGLIGLVTVAAINHFAGFYGWRVLMEHSFIKPLIDPIDHPVEIGLTGYLHAVAGLRVIPYTFMTVGIFVAVAAWKQLPAGSIFRDLLILAGISVFVRLAMFPNADDRFFVWAYLLVGISLTCPPSFGAGHVSSPVT